MHTVNADTSHYHQTQVTHQQATVFDGIRHGQNPRANISLQQVYDRVSVGYLGLTPPVLLQGNRLLLQLFDIPGGNIMKYPSSLTIMITTLLSWLPLH